MSVLDASEELIQLAKDLDSFDLDLDGESFLLDDPQDWSTSDDAAKPPCQDEIEDGTTSSTDNAAFSAARPKPRRVRKNYDGPFGKRTYFDLTTGDVGKISRKPIRNHLYSSRMPPQTDKCVVSFSFYFLYTQPWEGEDPPTATKATKDFIELKRSCSQRIFAHPKSIAPLSLSSLWIRFILGEVIF